MSTPPYGGSPIPPGNVQPGGVWPPPAPSPSGYGEPPNTSGQKSDIPQPISNFQWNWGAFAWGWLWLLNHGLIAWGVLFLVAIFLAWIPILGAVISLSLIVCHILLGVNGHKLAWQNRRYEGGVSQYLAVETAWKNWGIGLFVLSFLTIPILAAILFPVFARARDKAREEQFQRPSSRLSAPHPSYDHTRRPGVNVAMLQLPEGIVIRIEAHSNKAG